MSFWFLTIELFFKFTHSLLGELGLTMMLDDISSKGDSYNFRGVVRRLGDKRGGNDRREAQVWQADVTRKMALFTSKAKN